jgi:proteasome activator subunit 4
VLERSFPALQGLLETHRTTACMGALAAVAIPFLSRTNYPAGSKNLLPLLDLFVPGLDVNDPLKTLSSVAFIIQSLATVKIADLTRPEALDDSDAPMEMDGVHEAPPAIQVDGVDEAFEGPVLSRAEEDDLTRQSTADFPDWIVRFFKAVLALYDNLPEPGRSGRSGGKLEETMISTVTVACDFVLGQCSPEIYDIALNIFKEHVIDSPRANSARAIGHLAACFGRANPQRALKALLPICIEKIKMEIAHGASSTRTTSSSSPIESDNAFHWYCLLLLGTLHMSADQVRL